jgi:hypothetical protein
MTRGEEFRTCLQAESAELQKVAAESALFRNANAFLFYQLFLLASGLYSRGSCIDAVNTRLCTG